MYYFHQGEINVSENAELKKKILDHKLGQIYDLPWVKRIQKTSQGELKDVTCSSEGGWKKTFYWSALKEKDFGKKNFLNIKR